MDVGLKVKISSITNANHVANFTLSCSSFDRFSSQKCTRKESKEPEFAYNALKLGAKRFITANQLMSVFRSRCSHMGA